MTCRLPGQTLTTLCQQWLDANEQDQSRLADDLSLACLLLAHEERHVILDEEDTRASACVEATAHGPFPYYDDLSWLMVEDYRLRGGIGANRMVRLMNFLNHRDSSVRSWFHYVAWMIRSELPIDLVRPILLNNMADKLGAVAESVGLLAVLHSDQDELFALAEAFEPEDPSFLDQFHVRLSQVRSREWNESTNNFWQAENRSRMLMWSAAKVAVQQ